MKEIDSALKNEGDVNISQERLAWQKGHIGPETYGKSVPAWTLC